MAYFRCRWKALFYRGLSEVLEFKIQKRGFENSLQINYFILKDILKVYANYIKNIQKKVYYSYYYTKEMLYIMAYIYKGKQIKRYTVFNWGIKNDENSCSPRFF